MRFDIKKERSPAQCVTLLLLFMEHYRCPKGRTPIARLEMFNLEYEILLALLFQMLDGSYGSLLCSIVVFLSRRGVTG